MVRLDLAFECSVILTPHRNADWGTVIDYLNDTLKKSLLFFTGKGGVGKTTLALATAMSLSRRGRKVAFATWGGVHPSDFPPFPLDEVQYEPLDVLSCFHEYVIQKLKFEKIYQTVFDNHVLKSFILAAPGLAETVIAGKIWDLHQKRQQDLLVVDLPSSGHAQSFFQSPLGVEKLFAVGFVHNEAKKIVELFLSEETRVDFVSLPEELPMNELLDLKKSLLQTLKLPLGYLIVNQCPPYFEIEEELTVFSPEVYRCYRLYQSLRKKEKEVEPLMKQLELPSIRIPCFPSPSFQETVQIVSRELEK